MGIAGRASLFLLVIARDPQILRGMQNGEKAAAVARLRNFVPADELDQRWQQKPEELRDGQRKNRKDCAEVAPSCQRRKSPSARANEKRGQNRSRWQRKFSRESQGQN